MSLLSAESRNWGVDLSAVYQSVDNALYKDLLVFGNYLMENEFNLQIDDAFCDNFRETFKNSRLKGLLFDNETIKDLYYGLKRDALSIIGGKSDDISCEANCKYNVLKLRDFLRTGKWTSECESAYNELKGMSETNQYSDLIEEVDSAKKDAVLNKTARNVDNVDTKYITEDKIAGILEYYREHGFLNVDDDGNYSLGDAFGNNEDSIEMMKLLLSIMKSFGQKTASNHRYISTIGNAVLIDSTIKSRLPAKDENSKEFYDTYNNFRLCYYYIDTAYNAASVKSDDDTRITNDIFSQYIGLLLNNDADKKGVPCGLIKIQNGIYKIPNNVDREYIENQLSNKAKTCDYIRDSLIKLNKSIEINLNVMVPGFSNRLLIKTPEYNEFFSVMKIVFDKYVYLLLSDKFGMLLSVLGCDDLIVKFRYDMFIYMFTAVLNELKDIVDETSGVISKIYIPNFIRAYKLSLDADDVYVEGKNGTCYDDEPSNNEYDKYIHSISTELYDIIHYIQHPGDSFDKYYIVSSDSQNNEKFVLTDDTLTNDNSIKTFFKDISNRILYLRNNKNDPYHDDIDSLKDALKDIYEQLSTLSKNDVDNEKLRYYADVAGCLCIGNKAYNSIIEDGIKNGSLVHNSDNDVEYNKGAGKKLLESTKNKLMHIYNGTMVDNYVFPLVKTLNYKIKKLNKTYPI